MAAHLREREGALLALPLVQATSLMARHPGLLACPPPLSMLLMPPVRSAIPPLLVSTMRWRHCVSCAWSLGFRPECASLPPCPTVVPPLLHLQLPQHLLL